MVVTPFIVYNSTTKKTQILLFDRNQFGILIQDEDPTVERWDLLAYTKLGRSKYGRLDLPYDLEDTEPPARQQMERLAAVAANGGGPTVVWSGAVRD